MMNQIIVYLGAITVGFFVVMQSGLNRKISAAHSIFSAVFMNSLVLCFSSSVLFFSFLFFKQNSERAQYLDMYINKFSWWYAMPGLCGLTIIMTVPNLIAKVGALRVFMFIVFGQLLTSLIWDHYIESLQVSKARILGSVIVFLGAFISTLKF